MHALLRVYAKCIDGEEDAARRRIENALGIDPVEKRRRRTRKAAEVRTRSTAETDISTRVRRHEYDTPNEPERAGVGVSRDDGNSP